MPMDHNDNDYQDQNLHLASEESSKISSVLRQFALPKFYFGDSLHWHLRFDSLVENEVFLGIPSREDNNWIDNFSQGRGGIEFSSTATESCALPRHDNVWSEATSTESVEMLLKAVGQEEMVPGENMVEESDPVDQLGSSTRQLELNLKEYNQMETVDDESPFPATEIEGNFSRLNKTTGVEGVHSECTLLAHETKFSSGTKCDNQEYNLRVTSENLNIDMKSTSRNQGDSGCLMKESLNKEVHGNLPILATVIDNAESFSEIMVAMSVPDAADHSRINDISLLNSNCISGSISEAIKEQEVGGNAYDARVQWSDAETLILEMHRPLEFPAKLESTEDHLVDICCTNSGETAVAPGKGESVSSFECFNEVPFIDKPAGTGECGIVVFSSGTEVKQPPEGCNMLTMKSSISLQGEESVEGIGIKGSHTDGLGTSTDYSFSGEFCMEKTLSDDARDVRDATFIQKEYSDDGDHPPSPLQMGGIQTCREDIPTVQVDVRECGLDGFSCQEKGNKLPLDSPTIVPDDNKKESGSASSLLEVKENVQASIASHFDTSIRDSPVLDLEVGAMKLTSSCVRGDALVDCDECSTPSYGIVNRSQTKDSKFVANREPNTSILKESLEVADEFAPGLETERSIPPDFASAGETKTVDQSAFLSVTSTAVKFVEASRELNENSKHPTCDLIVQDHVAEAAPSEKPKESEGQGNNGANSSLVPATISAVQIDESNQLSSTGISCTDVSKSKLSKQESFKTSDTKTISNFLSTSMNSGVNSISKEEETFTFDIRHLESQSPGGSVCSLSSIPSTQACKSSTTRKGSPSTSGISKIVQMPMTEVSHGSSSIIDARSPSGGLKISADPKSRRASRKSGKGSAKKQNQVKETTPLRQAERRDKSLGLLSPLVAGQLLTFESTVHPRGAVSIPVSSLPDLNASSQSAFFQQPFINLQQLQLRAQIFVYGSLIQGVAPDVACMVSAFDGGRSIWEPSWHACVEKFHGQKSLGINTETPVQSHPGAKAPDTGGQTFSKSEDLSSPAGQAGNKAIPSSVVNPMIPQSSPLWNISTPSCEALPSSSMARRAVLDSPLHPCRTPPMRNLVAHTTSWPSQAPFPVSWHATSQSSSFDTRASYSTFPILEPVRLTTSVKESSMPISSGSVLICSTPTIHTGAAAVLPGTSSLVDLKKVTELTGQTSAHTKGGKRKRPSGSEGVLQISVTASLADISSPVVPNHLSKVVSAVGDLSGIWARNQSDSMSIPVFSSHYSTSITVTSPSNFVPKGTSNQVFSSVLPSVSGDNHKSGDSTLNKTLDLEEFSKVEEAKLQAEEASIHAAAAVRRCLGLWSQLDQQKNSGLAMDSEAKLASASFSIAAAASVARAAAAAATIAASACMQAKQMADEAIKYGMVNASEYDAVPVSNSASYLANATPGSSLKGGDWNNPSSLVLSAARKAARKRVEAASAATRHAENLDAIVKAAELAAEAVSHAGKIVTMGDTFPLSELVVAGPTYYSKVLQVASLPVSKPNKVNPENINFDERSTMDMRITRNDMSPVQRELSGNIVDDQTPEEQSPVPSVKHEKKSSKALKDKKVCDTAKTNGIVSQLHSVSRSKPSSPKRESTTIIKEGSLVEVLKDLDDSKKAWFLANVLSLKDGEILVSYPKLQSVQGFEPLKEWISLEAKDGNPPVVRNPHPMTDVPFEGTRKRRRAAVKDYTWSVGDKVDAQVQDCWQEGIIEEKKNSTTLSVHFPAQGETIDVKVWHLRPAIVWIDGQWIEWSRLGQEKTPQGDTPIEKRAKLGGTGIETKGEGKLSENIKFAEIEKVEGPSLPLSASETAFNICGMRDGDMPSMARTMSSGLQKEGSRVVFGVPKPGKKRKFMEVSKHYVSDINAKNDLPSYSVKLSKFLTPQGSGLRGCKYNSKIDLKEKQEAAAKLKAFKPGKLPTIPGRTLPLKGGSTPSQYKASDTSSSGVNGSISNDEVETREENLTKFGSFTNVSEGGMVFTSQALPLENNKKTRTGYTKSERFNKGKLAPVIWKSEKSESIEKVAEPRRSNRQIQPTSRLLEGLQSLLTISKLPSSSHDKSHSKGTS